MGAGRTDCGRDVDLVVARMLNDTRIKIDDTCIEGPGQGEHPRKKPLDVEGGSI